MPPDPNKCLGFHTYRHTIGFYLHISTLTQPMLKHV